MKTILRLILLFSWGVVGLSQGFAETREGDPQEKARLLMAGQLEIDAIKDPRVWEYLVGGDIIGNGGGIAEIRLHQIFERLPRLLRGCLTLTQCELATSERAKLAAIVQVAKDNRDLPYRLIFVSGKEYPLFFSSPDLKVIRTAKTGFTSRLPIFVNRDHLYRHGVPSLETDEMLSLLVHELGHQVGIREHNKLDQLGGRVSQFVMNGSSHINRRFDGWLMEWQVVSFLQPTNWAEMWWSWGEQAYSLTPGLRQSAKCDDPDRFAVGGRVTNIHWQRDTIERESRVARLGAWLKLFCEDSSGLIWDEDKDLQIEIHLQGTKWEARISDVKFLIE